MEQLTPRLKNMSTIDEFEQFINEMKTYAKKIGQDNSNTLNILWSMGHAIDRFIEDYRNDGLHAFIHLDTVYSDIDNAFKEEKNPQIKKIIDLVYEAVESLRKNVPSKKTATRPSPSDAAFDTFLVLLETNPNKKDTENLRKKINQKIQQFDNTEQNIIQGEVQRKIYAFRREQQENLTIKQLEEFYNEVLTKHETRKQEEQKEEEKRKSAQKIKGKTLLGKLESLSKGFTAVDTPAVIKEQTKFVKSRKEIEKEMEKEKEPKKIHDPKKVQQFAEHVRKTPREKSPSEKRIKAKIQYLIENDESRMPPSGETLFIPFLNPPEGPLSEEEDIEAMQRFNNIKEKHNINVEKERQKWIAEGNKPHQFIPRPLGFSQEEYLQHVKDVKAHEKQKKKAKIPATKKQVRNECIENFVQYSFSTDDNWVGLKKVTFKECDPPLTQEELDIAQQIYNKEIAKNTNLNDREYAKWIEKGNAPENYIPIPLGIDYKDLKAFREQVQKIRHDAIETAKLEKWIAEGKNPDNFVKREFGQSPEEYKAKQEAQREKKKQVQPGVLGQPVRENTVKSLLSHLRSTDESQMLPSKMPYMFVPVPLGDEPTSAEWDEAKRRFAREKEILSRSEEKRAQKWITEGKHQKDFVPWPVGLNLEEYNEFKKEFLRQKKYSKDKPKSESVRPECIKNLLYKYYSEDPHWHGLFNVKITECDPKPTIQEQNKALELLEKQNQQNIEFNRQELKRWVDSGNRVENYITAPLGIEKSQLKSFREQIRKMKTVEDVEVNVGDGVCDFSKIMCGPIDIATNVRYKTEFDDILGKNTDPDWYNKFLGINDKSKFDETIEKSSDPRVRKLEKDFLTKFFPGKKEHWHSITNRYYQSLWSVDTPVSNFVTKRPEKGGPASFIGEYIQKSEKILLIRSQTGTGKSVLIPLIVFMARWKAVFAKIQGKRKKNDPTRCVFGKIICTQPRVLNAQNISKHVARLTCTELKEFIGYDVGGEKKTEKNTMIIYQTIGKLLQDIKGSLETPEKIKKKYDTIIIDEVHERSVDQDLLLGLLLDVPIKYRPRIILMSATLDTKKFSDYFKKYGAEHNIYQLGDYPETDNICNVGDDKTGIKCDFTSVPSTGSLDYQSDIVKTIHKIIGADKEPSNGILVFLPGQGEISNIASKLKTIGSKYWIRTLTSETIKIFKDEDEKHDKSKKQIVLATNVGETGITFKDINYVIDSGLQKLSVYDPSIDANILLSTCVSQDSAIQRRGRIGRIPKEGYKFYPMYSKETWNLMETENKFSIPKIYLSDLASTILMLKDTDTDNSIFGFKWIDRPTNESVSAGLHKLFHLGAIDMSGIITPLGKMMNNGAMARISVEGRRALITASKKGVGHEVATILAMETVAQTLKLANFCTPVVVFPNIKSDHVTLLCIYQMYSEQVKKLKTLDEIKKWCRSNCLNYDALTGAQKVLDEILKIEFLSEGKKPENDSEDSTHLTILQCLFSGYFMRTGELPGERSPGKYYYLNSANVYSKVDNNGSFVFSNPEMSQAIYPKYIMYTDLRMAKSISTGIAQYKINLVSEINPNWFGNYAPDYRLVA